MVTPRSSAPPAVETLVRDVAPRPVMSPPLMPAPAPPEPKTASSQTMLLIIFGLLCFIAGLLAFTLRDRSQMAASEAGNVVVTDTRPDSLPAPPVTFDEGEPTPRAPDPAPDKTEEAALEGDDSVDASEASESDMASVDTVEGDLVQPPSPSAVTEGPEDALSPGDDEAPETTVAVDVPLPQKLIIYFKIDSNELADETLRELDQLAGAIKRQPPRPIRITGYTDAVGNLHYNFKVSEFRANIVKSFLVGKGLDPARIESRGFGPANPIASNDTLEGRRLNRRVEIELAEE